MRVLSEQDNERLRRIVYRLEHMPERQTYRRRAIRRGGGGGGPVVVTWAEITGVPQYNSAVDYYTVEKVNLINGVWTKDTIPITIDRALGYEGYVDATDIRNWVPWWPVGSLVQIIERWDEAAAANKWFLNMQMFYAGPESEASIRHSAIAGHVEAVWV